MSARLRFFATTARGLEAQVEAELRELGAAAVERSRGGVSFAGTLETGYRACLWLRTANRVLLPLVEVEAPDAAKLYGRVKSVRWSDHVPASGTLAVDFTSTDSAITHTHFGALKVKDAIVDQLRSVKGSRPSIDTRRPDVRVNVYLMKDRATLSIDLSGLSLHERGYRELGVQAPLKETLAAAILEEAGWARKAAEGGAFLDPMCGSGTIAIEAAMRAARRAPGLKREYFGFLGWLGHDAAVWKAVKEEARDTEIRDAKRIAPVFGRDVDAVSVRAARVNAERAGVGRFIRFERGELSDTQAPAPSGVVVLNPPYGERMGEVEELVPLYGQIGDIFKQRFKGWTGAILTGSAELAKRVGLKAARRVPLWNGPIECRLLVYDLY